MSGKTAANTT